MRPARGPVFVLLGRPAGEPRGCQVGGIGAMKPPRLSRSSAAAGMASALLVVVATLLLAACGGSDATDSASPSASSPIPHSSDMTPTTPASTAAPLPRPTVAGTIAFTNVSITESDDADICVIRTDGTGSHAADRRPRLGGASLLVARREANRLRRGKQLSRLQQHLDHECGWLREDRADRRLPPTLVTRRQAHRLRSVPGRLTRRRRLCHERRPRRDLGGRILVGTGPGR